MKYSNSIIEVLLEKFKPVIGVDYEKYKNHTYRVFLNCLLLDHEKDNEEKYALASVFHDIGIWTNNTIDYIDPSINQAKNYLIETGREYWIEEISLMIYWHHKISRYQGKNERIVEHFRKADWIDVSLGLLTFHVTKQKIRENRKKFPNLGFHLFLIKRIIKNFFQHPLKPLPMFRQ